MEKNFNIFQNVANNENQITEILSNYLQFKVYRDCFIEAFLPEINKKLISSQDLSTQVRIKNFQPDLIMTNDSVELFFEVKVGDAPLQKTQTTNYYNHLQTSNKQTALCFIIPEDYHELTRIEELSNENEEIKLIFWNEIIQLITEKEFDKSSQLFNEFLKFLKDWFEPMHISFTTKQLKLMYDNQIPEILITLFDAIEQIKKSISANKNIIISKTKTSFEHGFYAKDEEGKELFFFGIWYELWKDMKSPICIAVSPDHSLTGYVEAFKQLYPKLKKYEGWLCQFISEPEMNDELIKNITIKLNQLIEEQINNKSIKEQV